MPINKKNDKFVNLTAVVLQHITTAESYLNAEN